MRVYVIRQGDNLTKIANMFGVSVQDLQTLNGIKNPNSIFPGDTLKIPSQVLTDDDMKVRGTYVEHTEHTDQVDKDNLCDNLCYKLMKVQYKIRRIQDKIALVQQGFTDKGGLESLRKELEGLEVEKEQLEQQIEEEGLEEEERQLEQQIKDYESGTNNTEKPN